MSSHQMLQQQPCPHNHLKLGHLMDPTWTCPAAPAPLGGEAQDPGKASLGFQREGSWTSAYFTLITRCQTKLLMSVLSDR